MLHWQLLKWLKGLSLGTKIVFISTISHLWVLFFLFVLYRGSSVYNVTVTSTMINTDVVPVVFMPLHKSLNKSGAGQKKSGGSQKKVNSASISNSQESTPTKLANEKAGTILVEPVASKKQKNIKDKNKKQAKKEALKKVEQKKKKVEVEKKKEEPVKQVQEPIKPPVEESKSVEQEPIQSQTSSLNADSPTSDGDNVLYVGQQEMEALQMQDYIQQEMAQHWSPPSGMRKDLLCVVKIVVAFDGTLASIDFEQSSGVLLFDGAAKKAASRLQPPRWAYGKELSITFKP